MSLKTLKTISLNNKAVLIRVDFNVPMQDGKITDLSRIEASLQTINYVLDQGGIPVLMSHLGRPKGKKSADLSLKPVAVALQSLFKGKTVSLIENLEDTSIIRSVKEKDNLTVFLLENLRFNPGEEKDDPLFAKKLAAFGDIYVNDAFSAAHRAHASVTGITRFLPSYAGFQMEEEVLSLERCLSLPRKPYWAIVGGAKISTKLPLIECLMEKVDGLVIGGAMANTLLLAQGKTIGKSLVEPDLLKDALDIIKKVDQNNCELLIPTDVVVSKTIENPNPIVKRVEDVDDQDIILDMGPHTILSIKQKLQEAKTVVWNGPLGLVEVSPFEKGTEEVAKMIGALDAAKVSGGGDTVAILKKLSLEDNFSYISLAGGAFLEWLEGKSLPGLAPLMAE